MIKTIEATHDGLDIDINRKTNTVYTVWVGGNDGTGFASDMISAIDGKTDEIVATIGPGTIPSVAWTSRRIQLYISEVGGNPATVALGPVVGGGGHDLGHRRGDEHRGRPSTFHPAGRPVRNHRSSDRHQRSTDRERSSG